MTASHTQPAIIICSFVYGSIPAVRDGIEAALGQRLGMSSQRAASLLALANLAALPLMVASGLAIDQLGAVAVLITGSLLVALGFLALAVSRTVGQAVAAILLIGAAGACLGVSSLVLMAQAFYSSQPAASTNLGTLIWTLGALLTPAWLNGFLRKWGLRQSLLAAALIGLLPGLAAALTPWPTAPPAGHVAPVLDAPVLWLAALVLFLFIPLETLMAAWCTPYLTESGHLPRLASVLTAGFWLSFMAARLATGLLLGQDRLALKYVEPLIIVGLGGVAAVFLGNMAGTDRPRGASLGLLAVGACLGPVLPTLLGLVYRIFPASAGLAVGTVWAAGSLGGILLPPLLGVSAPKPGPKALYYPLILALLVAAGALVLALAL
jgi:fucose permease